MADLYVNESELRALSDTLRDRVSHMEDMIDRVPQTAMLLAGSWEGEAARAALFRMKVDEQALREMAEALSKAQQLLDSALDAYRETEDTVSSLWSL